MPDLHNPAMRQIEVVPLVSKPLIKQIAGATMTDAEKTELLNSFDDDIAKLRQLISAPDAFIFAFKDDLGVKIDDDGEVSRRDG
jgi:hypothetical protein